MTDLATDLKKMFDATMFDRLEAYWALPDRKSFERSDEHENAIEIFKVLLATVDAIPSSLIETAQELRAAEPQRFKDALSRALESVGYGFSPASATEFVAELNRNVQRFRDEALGHEATSAQKPSSESFLLFRRLPSPAARLARGCRIPFARTGFTDELSERIGSVDRYFDHALMGNGSSNIGGTGNFSILNRQTILGRRFAASGSRFDSDIPNAVIGWCPSERRPGQQEQRRS